MKRDESGIPGEGGGRGYCSKYTVVVLWKLTAPNTQLSIWGKLCLQMHHCCSGESHGSQDTIGVFVNVVAPNTLVFIFSGGSYAS